MVQVIHQPHDKFFKQAMAEIRVASEFFLAHLPSELLRQIDLDTLKLQKHSFVDEAYKSSEADVIYAVNLKAKGMAHLYVLCENQSTIDYGIALRLLSYEIRLLEEYRKQHPNSLLPVIFPMVVYTGERRWDAPRDFFTLFGEHELLAREYFYAPYHLIEVRDLSDDELQQRMWCGLVEFALKNQYVRDFGVFLDTLLPMVRRIEIHQGADFARVVLKYVTRDIKAKGADLLVEKAEGYLSNELRGEIMTIAQELEERGLKKGMQQGMQQGMRSALVALEQLVGGASVVQVARETQLPINDVKKLKAQIFRQAAKVAICKDGDD